MNTEITTNKAALIAQELFNLRSKRRLIEQRESVLRKMLNAIIKDGTKIQAGRYCIRTNKAYASVKIVQAQLVPEGFCRTQPCKNMIIHHFLETGELVPGAGGFYKIF